jgi:hypothetical protein
MSATKKQESWDAPENEAQNNFVSWGEVGDFVYGTLIGVREVKSTLPDKAGEMQKIYDVLVKEGSYHTLDEKKRVIEEAVVLSDGDLVSVGGRKTIDSRMARVKVGQVFGLKFVEELPAKTKGYSATKLIKVFTPKDSKGEYEMNEEWIASQKDELDMS